MNYTIGHRYKYPEGNRIFVLKRLHGNSEPDLCMFVFEFECGHRVTDNVFVDMIDMETGVQVFNDKQLKLF